MEIMTPSYPGVDQRRQPSRINIEYLADRPEFIPTLARWHYHEWANLRPGDSVEARILRLQGWCGPWRVPLTVIALSDDELLGSASLIEHDMDSRLELTPWLAGVFVAPQHRRKGIGAALVRRILDEAAVLHVSMLYLYTVESTAFYANLGWSWLEHTIYRKRGFDYVLFHHHTQAMTAAEFRRIALSMPQASESAHMDHPDFRVGGKIFATLGIQISAMAWSCYHRKSKRDLLKPTPPPLRRRRELGDFEAAHAFALRPLTCLS
jgi:GNAT superfamily N-acetyltransferase